MNRTHSAAAALLVFTCLLGPAQRADAQLLPAVGEVVNLVTYRVHTVFDKGNGQVIDKTVTGLIAVPRPIDVDNNGVPDLTLEILPLGLNLVTVRFARFPTALFKPMPLLAEILLDIPGGTGVGAGFDSRGDDMPRVVSLTANFSLAALAQGSLDFGVSAQAKSLTPRPRMKYLASFFRRGANGAMLDPTRATLELAPLPEEMRLDATIGPQAGARTVNATVDVGTPAIADLFLTHQAGGRELSVDATVTSLPGNVNLVYATADTALGTTQVVRYNASEEITRVDAQVIEREAGAIKRNVVAILQDVPQTVNVDILSLVTDGVVRSTTFDIEVPEGIGSIEAGLSDSGASPLAAGITQPAYAFARSSQASGRNGAIQQRAALRIPGLRSAFVDTGNAETGAPLIADLDYAGGDLRALIEEFRNEPSFPFSSAKRFSTDVRMSALPADVRVEFSSAAGLLSYVGGTLIPLVEVDLFKRDGLAPAGEGGMTPDTLAITIEDIPGTIDVAFAPAAPPEDTDPNDGADPEKLVVDFRAGETGPDGRVLGEGIGLIEALLSVGGQMPTKPLVALFPIFPDPNGIVFEDLPGKYAMQARIAGLKRVALETDGASQARPGPSEAFPLARVSLDLAEGTAGNPGFIVRVDRDEEGVTRKLEASLSNIAPGIELKLFALDRRTCFFNSIGVPCSFLPPGTPGLTVNRANRGTEVIYTADEPIQQLTLETDFGGLPNPLFARLSDLPGFVRACFSRDAACSAVNVSDRDFSFVLDASGRMSLDAILCQVPDDGSCTFANRASMSQGFFVNDLGFEDARFEMDLNDLPREIHFDTKPRPGVNQGISGDVAVRLPGIGARGLFQPRVLGGQTVNGTLDVDIVLGPFELNLNANNFPNSQLIADNLVLFQEGRFITRSGGLRCAANTLFSVELREGGLFDGIDLTPLVCE